MKKLLLPLLLLLIEAVSAQTEISMQITSHQFKLLDGKTFSMDAIKKNTASVFIFLLPDCPACENYSLTLNQLHEKYKSSGVAFYGVFPGHYNTLKEMKEYQNRYRINFQLMTDPEKKLVKRLGAKIAPEAVVLNNSGQTIYKGRIDDWMYAVGKKRKVITTHELQDALNAVVLGLPLKVKETKAVGCIIE